jgi:hypothetical protein
MIFSNRPIVQSFVTSWLLPTDPQSQSNDNGLIKITMPPKYKV